MLDLLKEVVIMLRYSLIRKLRFSWLFSEEFYRKGVELLPKKIDRTSIIKLRAFIDSAIKNKATNLWSDELGSDVRIYGAEAIFPEIEMLLPIDEMRKQGENYLSQKLPYHFVLAAKLQHRVGNLGSGGGWHRDSPFTPQFKFIVYLSDVDRQNGPFEYIPHTHTSLDKLRSEFNLGKMRFTEEEVNKQWGGKSIEVTGGEGSILIADTKGLHRGSPIQNGERYACTVYFFNKKKTMQSFSNLLQRV
jgi:hypothetical protein